MPPEEAPARLPIKDAAAQMGVSIDTVRRHLRQGKLHGEFDGGKWQVEVPQARASVGTAGSIPATDVVAMLQNELARCHEEAVRMQTIVERLLSERG